jgi:hypothetical protein
MPQTSTRAAAGSTRCSSHRDRRRDRAGKEEKICPPQLTAESSPPRIDIGCEVPETPGHRAIGVSHLYVQTHSGTAALASVRCHMGVSRGLALACRHVGRVDQTAEHAERAHALAHSGGYRLLEGGGAARWRSYASGSAGTPKRLTAERASAIARDTGYRISQARALTWSRQRATSASPTTTAPPRTA